MQQLSSRSLLASLLLSGSLSLSCGPATQSHASVPAVADGSKADATSLTGGQRQFGLAFLHQLEAEHPGKNLIFSPFSLGQAFAMTRAGARGETARQMDLVLRLPDGEGAHAGFQALNQALGGQVGVELKVVNRLFGQTGYQFLPDFLGVCANRYLAPLEAQDFRADPEASRRRINGWVLDQTQKKIVDLLPPRSLDTDTRLVLTNAVYFKGSWATRFDEAATSKEPFFARGTEEAGVPTMHARLEAPYAETKNLQVLELPYQGGELSMVLLLPRERTGLSELERTLAPDLVEARLREAAANVEKVQVALPRFELRLQLDLKKTMKALGMEAAFDSKQADFRGMEPSGELYIGGAYHQAYVKVNEEGTEAAAATAVVMTRKSMPPPVPVFRADHPFLFVIRHRATGAWLFMGRVTDPR